MAWPGQPLSDRAVVVPYVGVHGDGCGPPWPGQERGEGREEGPGQAATQEGKNAHRLSPPLFQSDKIFKIPPPPSRCQGAKVFVLFYQRN